MRHRDKDRSHPGQHRGSRHRRSDKDERRQEGARKQGPRQEGPRQEGPRPRHEGPRGERPSKPRFESRSAQSRPERPQRSGEERRQANADRPARAFGERPRDHFKKKQSRPARLREGRVVLYGWHTVKAALENPARRIHRLLASENAAQRLAQEVDLKVTPEIVRGDAIDAIVGPDAVHQGVMAEADALEAPAIEDLAPKGLLLVLDQITDPHNVGAILRTAAAFAVEAVITTERHSPEATGVLAKAASGALEYVPLVTVINLARGLEALKDKDVQLVGLDSTGESDLSAAPLRGPLALVLGAEGKGLRHLTRVNCDVLARLDLPGRIKSLNVSNATALALQVASTRLRAPG